MSNGSESRVSATLESRFRRSRRRRSSQENTGVRAAARGRRERDVISIRKVGTHRMAYHVFAKTHLFLALLGNLVDCTCVYSHKIQGLKVQ